MDWRLLPRRFAAAGFLAAAIPETASANGTHRNLMRLLR
jgi:hypothetical protein